MIGDVSLARSTTTGNRNDQRDMHQNEECHVHGRGLLILIGPAVIRIRAYAVFVFPNTAFFH
jgi:hypothetical protein